jgi:hypothetical protein
VVNIRNLREQLEVAGMKALCKLSGMVSISEIYKKSLRNESFRVRERGGTTGSKSKHNSKPKDKTTGWSNVLD